MSMTMCCWLSMTLCCWSCNNEYEYDLALLSGNNEYELVLLVI